MKNILVKCDFCKDCLDFCAIKRIFPNNEHSPISKIKIADQIYQNKPIAPEFLKTLEYCTTCGICNEHCAPHIDVTALIINLREWALESGKVKVPKFDQINKNIRKFGNPYGEDTEQILTHCVKYQSAEQEANFHLFLGCTLPIKHTIKIQQILELLNKLNLKFKIINKPICCGSILKNTGLTSEFRKNQKNWKDLINVMKIKEIVSICPGCTSTIKKIINELNLKTSITHVFEKIIPHLESNSIIASQPAQFHISCHLSTYNSNLYEQLVEKCNNNITLPPERKCCGAGGGLLGNKPEDAANIATSLIKEKLEMQVPSIITDCPFCYINLTKANPTADIKYIFDLFEI